MILLSFILLKDIVFAQDVHIDKTTVKYYNNINKAEELLFNNNSLKSLILYIDNFEDHGILYFKDFMLPFQVAIKKKDTVTSIKLLNLLKFDHENTKSLFNFFDKIKLDSNSIWYETANSLVDSSLVENQNPLKEYIDSMFLRDQLDRQNVYDKVWFARSKKMREWDENSRIRIDSIINKILELDLAEESLLGLDSSFYYHKKFYTILYHYPNSFIEYNSFFIDWINSGKMHPRHFAWVADFYEKHRNKYKKLSNSIFSFGVFASLSPKFTTEDFSLAMINEVNKQRLSICLPTIEHDFKLKRYINDNELIYYFYLY